MSFWLKSGAVAAMALLAWAAYRSTGGGAPVPWASSDPTQRPLPSGEPSRVWPGSAQEVLSQPAATAASNVASSMIKPVSFEQAAAVIRAQNRKETLQSDSLAQSAAFSPSAAAGAKTAAARSKTAFNYNQVSRKEIMGRSLGPVKNVGGVEVEGAPDGEIQTLNFESGQSGPAGTAGQSANGPIGSDAHADKIDGIGINRLMDESRAILRKGYDLLKRQRAGSKTAQKGSP